MNKSLMRDIFSLSVISVLLLSFPAHAQNNIVNKWNAGEGSDASGDASTAAGAWATSTEYGALSVGTASHAYSRYATAVGTASHVSQDASNGVAVGGQSRVDTPGGIAIGVGAQAAHDFSVALGTISRTTRSNEVYVGYASDPSSSVPDRTRVLGGVSDGTLNSDAATVGQLNRKAEAVYGSITGLVKTEAVKAQEYADNIAAKSSEAISNNTRSLTSQGRILTEHEARLKKQQQELEDRTTVAVDSKGNITRSEGERITVQEGLVRTQETVAENRETIMQNRAVTERNSRAIASQSRILEEHNLRLDSQQRQINENHEEMKRAAAQSAALAGLFQPYSVGKFNATAAVGGYSDKQAVAVGMGYRFSEQAAAKAGTAFSDGDVSWNVGVNWEF